MNIIVLTLHHEKMFRHGVSRIIMRLLILMDFHKIICYKICVMNI